MYAIDVYRTTVLQFRRSQKSEISHPAIYLKRQCMLDESFIGHETPVYMLSIPSACSWQTKHGSSYFKRRLYGIQDLIRIIFLIGRMWKSKWIELGATSQLASFYL